MNGVLFAARGRFRQLSNGGCHAVCPLFSRRTWSKGQGWSRAGLKPRRFVEGPSRSHLSPLERVREPMAPSFDPIAVERGWDQLWAKNIPKASPTRATSSEEVFSMVLPPPNITGALHLGHALTVTIQDALVRWQRMMGKKVLWVPGIDHAGIASQTVVEKKLWREKKLRRQSMTRQEFLEEMWDWVAAYRPTIAKQLHRLGTSMNWEKEVFTLDEKRSAAVTDAFVRLHDKGLVYRDKRMVNWCPALQTAISDIEVDLEEVSGPKKLKVPGKDGDRLVEFGVLHRFIYPVEGGGEIEVSTTRPETMLGDTAIAIHPDDPHHKHLHGRFVIHPFDGRRIPIICDETLVDPSMGTGAVKITPCHDPNDWQCAKRHNLPQIEVIDKLGYMTPAAGEPFAGQDRFDCREEVLRRLESLSLYRGKDPHRTSIPRCSRSGDILEPMLVPQWFVNCKVMAERSAAAVRQGDLTITPSFYTDTWFQWLDNIQDWCVSRQLWWGHRIPAYRVRPNSSDTSISSEHWVIAKTEEEARRKARELLASDDFSLCQDEDVLDTWFSSGLFPMAALGWPENVENDTVDLPFDMRGSYPLSVMETGADILFFWVARMTMLCSELSGELPFRKVVLHPMVRDKSGRKMSKSLGNVIDPLDIMDGIDLEHMIDKIKESNLDSKEIEVSIKQRKRDFPKGIQPCGTDALRYALAAYLNHGQHINVDVSRMVSARQFCNKVWNGAKFLFDHLQAFKAEGQPQLGLLSAIGSNDLAKEASRLLQHPQICLADRWILSRLSAVVEDLEEGLETFHFSSSVSAIHQFFLHDLCDVYIEQTKRRLNAMHNQNLSDHIGLTEEDKVMALSTLAFCMEMSLRMLHPFMPFLTEELWQRMLYLYESELKVDEDRLLATCSYPTLKTLSILRDEASEKVMEVNLEIVRCVRSLKQVAKALGVGISESNAFVVEVSPTSLALTEAIAANLQDISALSRAPGISISSDATQSDRDCLVKAVSEECRVLLRLCLGKEAEIKLTQELERLTKKKGKKVEAHAKLSDFINTVDYQSSTPVQIRERDQGRLDKLQAEIESLTESIETIAHLVPGIAR